MVAWLILVIARVHILHTNTTGIMANHNHAKKRNSCAEIMFANLCLDLRTWTEMWGLMMSLSRGSFYFSWVRKHCKNSSPTHKHHKDHTSPRPSRKKKEFHRRLVDFLSSFTMPRQDHSQATEHSSLLCTISHAMLTERKEHEILLTPTTKTTRRAHRSKHIQKRHTSLDACGTVIYRRKELGFET